MFKNSDPYLYLNEIKEAVIKGLPFPIDEINFVGTRKSKKTTESQIMFRDLLAQDSHKIDIYMVRSKVSDAEELFDDTQEIIQEAQWEKAFLIHWTKRQIKAKNVKANGLRVMGLKTTNKARGKTNIKLGLKKSNAKYIIVFFEEAHEITFDEKEAVLEAIRGSEHILVMSASNPWSAKNEYIAYCNNNLKFNKKALDTDYQQFKIVELNKNRVLFHYTRWELNEHLSKWEINRFESIRLRDPRRAKIVADGMPGVADGSVYADYLPFLIDIDKYPKDHWVFKPDTFKGGVDWGSKRDSTRALLIGIGHGYKWKARYDEYSHSNLDDVFKSNLVMADEVIDFYVKQAHKYPQIPRQGLTVEVEYMSSGIIDYMNKAAGERGLSHWLYFAECVKVPISVRIDIDTNLMAQGVSYISNNNCPKLLEEYEIAQYEEDRTDAEGLGVRMDINDHSINADEYGTGSDYYNFNKVYDDGITGNKYIKKDNGYNGVEVDNETD